MSAEGRSRYFVVATGRVSLSVGLPVSGLLVSSSVVHGCLSPVMSFWWCPKSQPLATVNPVSGLGV